MESISGIDLLLQSYGMSSFLFQWQNCWLKTANEGKQQVSTRKKTLAPTSTCLQPELSLSHCESKSFTLPVLAQDLLDSCRCGSPSQSAKDSSIQNFLNKLLQSLHPCWPPVFQRSEWELMLGNENGLIQYALAKQISISVLLGRFQFWS